MTSAPLHQPRTELGARHLFLVGFLGSGKTTVGRALAERIGRGFVDLDQSIAGRAGTSLREVFRRHGDVGFLARERAALREVLDSGEAMVVATGATTYLDSAMRDWIRQAGKTAYLQASPDVLVARIEAGEPRSQRPLVGGPRPEETVRRMLAGRAVTYEQSDITVRTDLARVDQVVDEIVRTLRLDRRPANRAPRGERRRPARAASHPGELRVSCTHGSYPVRIRNEGAAWLAAEIGAACPGNRLAVISDETVASLHAAALVAQLQSAGSVATCHTVAAGEPAKTLSAAAGLADSLLAQGVGPKDTLVALGGGAVNDLTGFVAATLHGGMDHVRILTTTAAAIDASVGGRAFLHTRHGPNLIGTIRAPRVVLISLPFLASQSRRRHTSGMASAVRLAATLDASFFDALALDAGKLLALEPEPLALALSRAIALANRAHTEGGDAWRFGRVLGAALEVADPQALPGEAAARGMVAECEWAASDGSDGPGACRMLAGGLAALELPVDWRGASVSADRLAGDSGGSGSVRLVHVTKLGTHEIRPVPVAALVEFVRRTS